MDNFESSQNIENTKLEIEEAIKYINAEKSEEEINSTIESLTEEEKEKIIELAQQKKELEIKIEENKNILDKILEEANKKNAQETEEPSERKVEKEDFINFIPLKEIITKEEALKLLTEYYNTSPENVENAFINLRNLREDGTVRFEETINRSKGKVIKMILKNSGGWDKEMSHFMDTTTGQPLSR